MPNDRLWLHWLVLLVAGGVAILAAVFTPDIGWLRLGLGVFGGVLVVIGIAGALDIGWGRRGGETSGGDEVGAGRGTSGSGDEPEREGEEPGRSGGPPPGGDPEAERLREVGEQVRRGPDEEEVRSEAEAGAETAPDEEDGGRGGPA